MKAPSFETSPYAPERRDLERLEPELRALWAEAVSAYPELSSVEIVVPEKDETLGFTGGEFLLPDEDYENPAVIIVPGGQERFEALKTARPLAVGIAAGLLGRSRESLSGAELKAFIFLHELGHAREFAKDFAGDPGIGPEAAVQAWRDRSARELDSLPVPGLDPNDLNLELEGRGLEALDDRDPALRGKLAAAGLTTVAALLDAQERAYRNLPKEAYADRFAADFLKGRL